jgi:hypothetical protein
MRSGSAKLNAWKPRLLAERVVYRSLWVDHVHGLTQRRRTSAIWADPPRLPRWLGGWKRRQLPGMLAYDAGCHNSAAVTVGTTQKHGRFFILNIFTLSSVYSVSVLNCLPSDLDLLFLHMFCR